jgi:hypothetical protein
MGELWKTTKYFTQESRRSIWNSKQAIASYGRKALPDMQPERTGFD